VASATGTFGNASPAAMADFLFWADATWNRNALGWHLAYCTDNKEADPSAAILGAGTRLFSLDWTKYLFIINPVLTVQDSASHFRLEIKRKTASKTRCYF
jgi:hypothetical protein